MMTLMMGFLGSPLVEGEGWERDVACLARCYGDSGIHSLMDENDGEPEEVVGDYLR